MEENKTPNKSEKDIIKENMLILYKAYQDGEKNTVDEISYYKQIALQSEKSPIMYGLQDVYPVNIKEPEKFYGNRILLYQNGTPIAMIDENSNIKFSNEYLAQMKELHLGDAGSVKGHRGGDFAHALGGGGVGARGVDAGCTGRCSSGGAAGCIAGSQTGCGDAAHGGSGSDLQKAFAGDLFHNKVPFSSFSSCFVPEWQKCFAILVKSITFTTKEKEVIISL